FERAQGLHEGAGIVSRTESERRELEYREAEASLLAARSVLAASRRRLQLLGVSRETIEALCSGGEVHARLTIAAPLDAQVVEREVTLGELVSSERES